MRLEQSIGWLVVAAPILVFPELLWPKWVAVPFVGAIAALMLAAWVSRDSKVLFALVSALGIVAIIGGWIGREYQSGLSHFCNFALGILVMCAVPHWARTERRMLLLAILLMGLSALALFVGLIGSDLGVLKLLPVSAGGMLPRVSVQLPGLASYGVNRNVVGILAVMLMPMAYVVGTVPHVRAALGVRGVAWILVAIGALVALASQSLSVWVAAWAVVVLSPVWRVRRSSWRVSVAAVALAAVPLVIVNELLVSAQPISHSDFSQFDLRTWTPDNVGVTSQGPVAPDGTSFGIKLVETTDAGRHVLVGSVPYAPGTHSLSVFVKAAERSSVMLSAANSRARFHLHGGRTSDEAGLLDATLTPASNGWVRCVLTFTSMTGGEHVGISLLDDQGSTRYQGTAGAGVYLWRATVGQVALLGSSSLGTLRTMVLGSAARSLQTRREIWSAALSVARQAPWGGIGFSAFRHRPEALDPEQRPHAHNILVQTMLDIGIIGLALYVTLITTLLRWARRVSHGSCGTVPRIAGGAGLVLVGTQVFGIGDAIALGAKVGLLQWLAAGLVVSAMRLEPTKSET